MNDFFARQDSARRKSGFLVFYFVAALIVIILLLYTAVVIALSTQQKGGQFHWFIPDLFYGIAVVVTAILALGSAYKIITLRQGGEAVASMMGGELLQTNTHHVLERRLLNVVEEMAIASGVPVPPVYLMRHEEGINAFAAGFNPDDAVIGITKGAVESLTRDELQGVIAHEFSHILHGDMRLNIRLMGWVHGILLIHIIGYWMFRFTADVNMFSSRRSRDDSSKFIIPILILGVSMMAIGSIGVFFGRLIKSAVSRQREFLADAAAVQFTRNPDGIGNALIKVGRISEHAHISHRRGEEISHMFFGSPFSRISSMMSTHPPLPQRISAILPHFDGNFPEMTYEDYDLVHREATAGFAQAGPTSMLTHQNTSKPSLRNEVVTDPDEILEIIGAPLKEHVQASRKLIQSLPEVLLDSAREPFGARALIYVLLLDEKEDIRNAQLTQLEKCGDQAVYTETLRIAAFQSEITPAMRLPLIDLSLGALRALSPPQYETFRKNVEALSSADQNITLFEYTLRHILVRHLDASAGKPRLKVTTLHRLSSVHKEANTILSMLSRYGHSDESTAEQAFNAAAHHLPEIQSSLRLLPLEKTTLAAFHRALNQLAKLDFEDKKGLLVACLQCVTHDQVLNVTEAELFRAIADALECPMPIWV